MNKRLEYCSLSLLTVSATVVEDYGFVVLPTVEITESFYALSYKTLIAKNLTHWYATITDKIRSVQGLRRISACSSMNSKCEYLS